MLLGSYGPLRPAPPQVFSTYSNEDYDRRNEDVDPMAASAEYELEKRVERLELFPVELEKGERPGQSKAHTGVFPGASLCRAILRYPHARLLDSSTSLPFLALLVLTVATGVSSVLPRDDTRWTHLLSTVWVVLGYVGGTETGKSRLPGRRLL